MKKRIILLLVAASVLAGTVIGYRMYNKPHTDLGAVMADYHLTATKLLAEYEASEQEANSKYLGKIIRVEGTLLATTTDDNGQISLTLNAGGLMGGVICQLDPQLKVVNYLEGQQVTLNGLCTGMLMDVVLVRCKPV